MTLLLTAVAAISLAVGGIGIMNIMLVSVTERTREIGIRMAVGARERDVLIQFLVEAMTMSIAGGILGTVLGIGASKVIAMLAGWMTIVSIDSILLATLFSGAVGIFFGFYPCFFERPTFVRYMPQVAVPTVDGFKGVWNRDIPGSSIYQRIFPRTDFPLSPGGDNPEPWIKRHGGQFETDLVVALTSSTMRQGICTNLMGYIYQVF